MKSLRLSEDEYSAILKRKVPERWPSHNKVHKFDAQATNGYDSKLESRRAEELRLMAASGAISDLEEQRVFILIDPQYDKKGKLAEHGCSYRADFVYRERGELVVEDCKGMRSGTAYALYVVKRKLLLQRYGLRVREITKAS